MAVSLNSVIVAAFAFDPSARFDQVTRTNIKAQFRNSPTIGLTRQSHDRRRARFYALTSNGDNLTTEITPEENIQSDTVLPQPSEPLSNGAAAVDPTSTNKSGSADNANPTLKRSSLTARERLRAARVLSRYTDSSPTPKPSKPELGSRLLDALQETDKGKKRRSGLPEAPTNLFDDSKRGMPKPGWTFNFPGGMDVLFVVASFVLISTVMFATTFIVWKVGAIHFNEY